MKMLPATPPAPVSTEPPRCPRCDGSPALERFRRYEVVTYDPLSYCGRCFGFWAVGDSLSRGVADPYDEHPAPRAAMAPRACKQCAKPLAADGGCRRCHIRPPLPPGCPRCGEQMEAEHRDGIEIDHCPPCRGTWFDTGEIGARFGVTPVIGLASSRLKRSPGDDEATPPGNINPIWLEIGLLLVRLFLRI